MSLCKVCAPALALLDACCGASRLIAAGITGPSGTFFARARVPEWLWAQLLPRQDAQIGVQEALGVWLLVCSFRRLLGSSLLIIYVDNDGVTAAYINGSSNSPEVNAMVAVFWLFIEKTSDAFGILPCRK